MSDDFKAGFPFHQLDKFLKTLVQDLNEHVAISEEYANNAAARAKSGGLMFDRKVARVVTTGTLIDEKFMDPNENNFLLAVHVSADAKAVTAPIEIIGSHRSEEAATPTPLVEDAVGLAWIDLSTGDFSIQETKFNDLSAAVSRIGAKEVVVLGEADGGRAPLAVKLEQQQQVVTQHSADLKGASVGSWKRLLEGELEPKFDPDLSINEIYAAHLLLSYVQDRLQGSDIRVQPPIRQRDKENMRIDAHTMKSLEVLGTSKEGYGKGSLLNTVRRTVTRSGTRLLRNRIASPSMSLTIINQRLDLVSTLLQNVALREQLVTWLKRSTDSHRLLQKFSMGRGDADDLISLSRTIDITRDIAQHLNSMKTSSVSNERSRDPIDSLAKLHNALSLNGPIALAHLIQSSVDEQGLLESHRLEDHESNEMISMAQEVLSNEGSTEDRSALQRVAKAKLKQKTSSEQDSEDQKPWIIRRAASHALEELHRQLEEFSMEKLALTNRLRLERNAQSLTLRWTPGLGYICHIKGKPDVRASQPNARLLKATKSTSSVHDTEWSSLGGRIDQVKSRVRAEEQKVLQDLRAQVIRNLIKLRRNASTLDELDVGCSFARLADEQKLVRPRLSYGYDLHVVGGRHPTVSQGLEEQGRAFVSNDCHIGAKERIWLITGPNMAGKSTFLRQNALIAILAQAGSFVPADSADIGLIDQIFTRVGSADNLFKDQSTFMVEMMETAIILKQATARSLVIMDEIGRGTTPEDGIAVGYACLHHLYYTNCCRTLFATHFHSLADMTKEFDHLGCHCTDISEDGTGSFAFVHRLRRGVNRSSHALKIAALAGVPQSAIETARSVLQGKVLGRADQAPNSTVAVA